MMEHAKAIAHLRWMLVQGARSATDLEAIESALTIIDAVAALGVALCAEALEGKLQRSTGMIIEKRNASNEALAQLHDMAQQLGGMR